MGWPTASDYVSRPTRDNDNRDPRREQPTNIHQSDQSSQSSGTSGSEMSRENASGYRDSRGNGGGGGPMHTGRNGPSLGSFTKPAHGQPMAARSPGTPQARTFNATEIAYRAATNPLSTPSSQVSSRAMYSPPARSFSSPQQQSRATGQITNRSPSNPTSYTQSSHRISTSRNSSSHWVYMQELKVKVSGLPRGHWTAKIYEELSEFGTIVRIEMGTEQGCAWVTFEPPPRDNTIFVQPIYIISARVNIIPMDSRFFTIISPVNPGKTYFEKTIFYANSIDFGATIADKTMSIMRTADAYKKVKVTLNLGDRKELDVQFPLMIDGETRKLRFRLPLSLVSVIYKVQGRETGECTLIIPFESPPQFFMQAKRNDISKTCKARDRTWIEWYSWFRMTDIVDRKTRNRLNAIPVMDRKDTAILDIGRWTAYRISFDSMTLQGSKYEDFSGALTDHGVAVTCLEDYALLKGTSSPLRSLLEDETSGTHPHLERTEQNSAITFAELVAGKINLSFPVRYQLEACLTNGILNEYAMTREFLERLVSMNSSQAVLMLEKIMDQQRPYYNPLDIFNIRTKAAPAKKVPNYCILSRSANITPTMIHVGTPMVETSNRIIRKHAADADRFIRVKFSDEKTEGQIHGQDDNRSDEVFNRIARAMNNGIVVAGRYYEFLAFGNSQFREHGAYFYAPTNSKSAQDIRLSMGRFDHIKTAAKLGARLGQCFSTTRAIKSINVKVVMIPDIERNGYNFTDGVGQISLFLAQMAAQELGLHSPFDDPPSLYQFRLGGCKGVLALDPKITGSVIHIRPSQYKFEAQNVGLEIIRASALAVATFNRQLIIILSTLGVPDFVFIQKQQDMVNYLEKATRDESVALEKLQRNIDFNQTTLTMAGMILDGFMERKDPFMMSLLQLWRAYTIKYLKEKARIVIEDGAFVLGCIDETATLHGHSDDPQSRLDATKEEKLATLPEIFLQISHPTKKGHYRVIEGPCILARNPSLHPGDVRMVRAIDVPTLRHLKNVVVLPQTGDRDIANMCSGGDLDGDDYIVLWDNDFLPEIVNEPPMDFTAEKPVDSEEPIKVKDITDFFVTYMKNDSLGRIATAHLAQADYNEEGVRDEKCLELARLHSQAVDYNKSGIPAIMDRELRPRKYPHFQENKFRPAHKVYKSKKILGMLYDQVQLVDFKPDYESTFDARILNAFPLEKAMLDKASDIKAAYDSALRRLMAKHAIRTEFEAWSVFVMSHNLETRDYTFAEEFGRTIGVLKSQYREMCQTAVGSPSGEFAVIAPFIAAMYTVTAREIASALEECRQTKIVGDKTVPARKMEPESMPLMSFPWLFVNELGKIANNSLNRGSVQVQQSFSRKQGKKHIEGPLDPESGLGEVETTEGITHYGELLKLDFASASSDNSLNNHRPAQTAAVSKLYGGEPLNTVSSVIPSPSPSHGVTRNTPPLVDNGLSPKATSSSSNARSASYQTKSRDAGKQNAPPAVAKTTVDSSLSANAQSSSTENRHDNAHEEVGKDEKQRKTQDQDQEAIGSIIDQSRKASALDRLTRFL